MEQNAYSLLENQRTAKEINLPKHSTLITILFDIPFDVEPMSMKKVGKF